MADENIVTNIVAKSDFSNLIADLHKVSYSLTSLQDKLIATNKTLASQVGVMNRSFAETLRSTGQYSTRFVSLTSDVDKFGNQLEKGQMKLSKFFNVYGQHAKTSGGLIRDLARQQVQLQNAIMQPLGKNAEGLMQYNVHIPRGLDAVKNKTAIARQELQIMNKVVQQGAGQLINWGKNTQWAGRQLTVGLTVPLVAFGKASADAFKQADEQLVRLTKVYGGVAQTSARDLAKIRADVSKTATDLSKSYGASFKDTLSLAADIAATGKQGDDLLGSLRETTRLSVLGEVDKQDAMKATLAIQSAFKQNTEELTESINFLNAVENQTSTTLNDLVEAIPKAGPIIRGLGGSIQDLALYLTAMREGGINASEGANALKSGLASLINPTKVAKGMFQDLGISLENIVNKNAGNTTATILELQSALETLNPLQKQQALEQLFGKFQFARMNALFENLGKQGSQTLQVMDLMKASSQDLASLADRELGQVTESASGKYRRAVEGLRADLASIGDQFLTINANLINFVDGVIKFIQQLPGPIKQALGFFGMLTAVAGPLIMLTGVLGNFFGYIIKGAYHFKSLFKGGEGWKLLTPEILAAQKAGALVETTFYSDAKAAAVLKQSINELALSYANLQQKASMAATSTNPAVRTAGGNLIMAGGGQRQVDPNNPMTGKRDTRDFSHINPVGQMSPVQKQNQTIFGVLPGSEGVNARISNNPQMYMNKDMPKIPGLTTINGVSTGIVAAEAAKWHAMTGALAMQSQAEIKLLKVEVAQTGLITQELSTSYQALLPEMTRLTALAATKSQAIVAQLQAGKMSVDQAMIRIRALNFEIEAMMGQAATQVAAAQGRNINLTGVPLLNQAVVGPDGKSNFKELSRPGRTRGLLSTIAGRLGVKTYGAGYSMETTIPKKMAYGGSVPGSGNTDTVPAMLTPGEFVINKEATAANLPLLQAINGPGGNGPGYALGSKAPIKDIRDSMSLFYEGRQISHLGTSYNSASRPGAHAELMQKYNVTQDQLNNPRTSVHGGMSAAYHRFFNQGTARSSLPIGVAIDYLSGKPIPIGVGGLYDPNSKIMVRHDPAIAYQAMMQDLGIDRSRAQPDFIRELDGQIIQDLKNQQASGKTILADRITGANAAQRASSSLIGQSVNNVIYKGGPGAAISGGWGNSAIRNLRLLNQDSEIRVPQNAPLDGLPRNRGVSTNSIYRNVESRASVAAKSFNSGRSRPKQFVGSALKFIASVASRGRVGRNRGGIIGMNAGGMVPMPQQIPIPIQNGQYNMGGMVQGYNRGGMIGGMLGQMALPMLGYMGGQSIGTQLGGQNMGYAGGMMGSMGVQMLMGGMGAGRTAPGSDEAYEKYASKLNTAYTANNKFSLSLANSAAQGSKLSKSLMMIVGGITKTNIVLAAGTTALMVGYNAFKNYQKGVELNNSTFGLTAEAAEKAGLKVKDYNSSIKDSISTINATIERNKMLYDSMNSAGVPIKMTIEEYKKLKEEVKVSMSSSIEAINRMKETDLKDYAERLKAQMIAAGASADDAAKKIYAAFALSNKFALAGSSTVGSFGFNNIKDGITAAIEAFEVFLEVTNDRESTEAQGLSLTTSLEATNKAVEEAIALSQKKADEDKKGTTEVISRSQAEIQVIDAIKAKVSTQGNISQGLLDTIIDQNKEASKFLSLQDTALSTYQKLRLQAQGYTGDLSMGAEAADRLFSMRAAIESKVTTYSTSQGGPLFGLSQKLKDAQAQYKKLQLASKGASVQQQVDSRKATEAINEKIKKIKEEADARRKALSQQQQDEDFLIQIKKKQLEYQNALAAGDMSTAAQAQLDLQSLNKQQQVTEATRAIDEKEKLDLKPLEDELKRLSDVNQKLSDSAASAGNGLQKLSTDIEKYKTQMSGFIQSLTNFYTFINNPNNKNKSVEGEAARFLKDAQESGIKMPNKFDGPRQKSSTEMAQEIAGRYKDLLTNIDADTAVITVKSATLNGEAIAGETPKVGYTGRYGGTRPPVAPKTTTYSKKPEYSPGSYFSYNAPTVPKLHNLNGPVPGPYGKEVSAILKAGTEGVYQEPYINSLKNNQNNTTGGVFNFSSIVNAAEGQDANQIADAVLRKVAQATKEMNTKMGVR
jgi:TP901 family phage tail tape measure protein